MAPEAPAHDLGAAVGKLLSLHDGDEGVAEVIACGTIAIPALHSILLTRDKSGFFETRRRAVAALETLKAFRVLREFLESEHRSDDPIEGTGEDAVVNEAARVLGRLKDPGDVPLLFELAQEKPRAGVIDALGEFRHPPALPLFVEALGDDFSRSAAEGAICKLGVVARPDLLLCAISGPHAGKPESSTSIGRRRSALRLLQDIPLTREMVSGDFRFLLSNEDPWIVVWSSRIALKYFETKHHPAIIERLVELLRHSNELIAEEIEDVLVENYAHAQPLITRASTAAIDESVPVWRSDDHTSIVFDRVRKRVNTQPPNELPL